MPTTCHIQEWQAPLYREKWSCSQGRLAWQYQGRGKMEGQGNHLQQQILR